MHSMNFLTQQYAKKNQETWKLYFSMLKTNRMKKFFLLFMSKNLTMMNYIQTKYFFVQEGHSSFQFFRNQFLQCNRKKCRMVSVEF